MMAVISIPLSPSYYTSFNPIFSEAADLSTDFPVRLWSMSCEIEDQNCIVRIVHFALCPRSVPDVFSPLTITS